MVQAAVVGSAFAGQSAVLYLASRLRRHHEITVINHADRFLFYPSLVWVGVGHMKPVRTRLPLQPVHDRFLVRLVRIRHGICMDWQWPEETLQESETLVAVAKDRGAGNKPTPLEALALRGTEELLGYLEASLRPASGTSPAARRPPAA